MHAKHANDFVRSIVGVRHPDGAQHQSGVQVEHLGLVALDSGSALHPGRDDASAGSQPEGALELADYLSRPIIQRVTHLRVLRASACICARPLVECQGQILRQFLTG